MRSLSLSPSHTKIKHMLEALQLVTVRQRLYDVCIFICEIINGTLAEQLRNRIIIVGDLNERHKKSMTVRNDCDVVS